MVKIILFCISVWTLSVFARCEPPQLVAESATSIVTHGNDSIPDPSNRAMLISLANNKSVQSELRMSNDQLQALSEVNK